ncbi:hypothetical protein [Glaciihabitans sp. dw_435]|uniref:hypothetical protein n=1 Tax=Glaciihabitans sp. dw_435 TaxID=2720081 RepID=UPI001BD215DF|nr:hypothetical protein [Glaciihabitans sp. dw_435]
MRRWLHLFVQHRIHKRYWMTLEPLNTVGEVHVVPNRDRVIHAPTDCICGPTTEACMRPDGSNGWVVVHHSLDGRESRE